MRQLKVLALAKPEYLNRIEEILECDEVNRMATLSPEAENLERAESLPVDCVVLMSSAFSDDEVRFMEELYMRRSSLTLILIGGRGDAATFSDAMRCGITRIIPMETPGEKIIGTIMEETGRLLRRRESARVRTYDSKTMAIFSTKGGSGKTSVAVNLAVALAGLGKKTLVLDLDLQFGDIGVFMNIPGVDTISDLASEPELTPNVIKGYLYMHTSGVYVMCAPVSPELAELVKPEHIEKIISVLRPEFDYIIFDLAPALDDCTLTALDMADVIYFVTNPEIPTLKNTRSCMNVLDTLQLSHKVQLILNRDGDRYVSRRDVETALDREVALSIPWDPKSSSLAINRGIPVVTSCTRSPMSKAIVKYAGGLV